MIYLGCSGWQYKHWRETFYPKGVPQRLWLEFYMERFQIVELNNSFYRLPPPETFEKWRLRTPDDFIFAVKASRYLTHIKRLKDPEEPVERFMKSARQLGKKLGPVLIQLPPNLQKNLDDLSHTLDLFGDRARLTVEFRHDSWYTPDVEEALTERGVALTWADRKDKVFSPLWKTADWGFLRLHEGLAKPRPCYSDKILGEWAERLASTFGPDADIYVFFNNDPRACALKDAITFSKLCGEVGLETTRVPTYDEVTIARYSVAPAAE